jgi:protein-S-isoprenylcysteine O-methyltransferase Ste14
MHRLDTAHLLIGLAWEGFAGFWLFAAFFASRAVKRQTWLSRILTMVAGAVPFALLFIDRNYGPLSRRFVPGAPWVLVAGVALTYAGLGLAIWARIILGRNWSGTVTIKEDHKLVQTGPYSVVRHPIYSGLLLAVLGTALVKGEWRGLLAAVLVFPIFAVKARTEERFMIEQFGEAYEQYRRHTRALVPPVY